jgi:hypothetical protein
MANEITQLPRRSSEVAEVAPTTNTLPTALELVAGLRDAIASMKPDDVILEVNSVQDGHRASQRLSLRCYRKGEKVIDVDEERNAG